MRHYKAFELETTSVGDKKDPEITLRLGNDRFEMKADIKLDCDGAEFLRDRLDEWLNDGGHGSCGFIPGSGMSKF